MPDHIRPGDNQQPDRLTVLATVTLDVELLLQPPHASLPRVDTIARYRDQVVAINGTPSATPQPVRLAGDFTGIAQVHVKPWGFGIRPDQITNLQVASACSACDCHQPPVRQGLHVTEASGRKLASERAWDWLTRFLRLTRG